jgi:hypothetical protein
MTVRALSGLVRAKSAQYGQTKHNDFEYFASLSGLSGLTKLIHAQARARGQNLSIYFFYYYHFFY